MKNLIIHIGPHKTGSTYIQKVLFFDHERLKANRSIYPLSWIPENLYGHHSLKANISKSNTGLAQKLKEFSLSPYQNFILSSENIPIIKLKDLKSIKSIIPDNIQVKIVYYFRRIPKLLPSFWQEDIKHGKSLTLPSFLIQHISSPFNSDLINYSNVLNKFAAIFGKSSLYLISYDNLLLRKADIIQPIYELLDICIPTGLENKIINPSLPTEIIEFIRLINFKYKLDVGVQSLHTRYFFLKLIENRIIQQENIVKLLSPYKETLSISDDSFILKSLYNYTYQHFSENIINPSTEQSIFDNTGSEKINFINSNILVDDKINSYFVEIYKMVYALMQKKTTLQQLININTNEV